MIWLRTGFDSESDKKNHRREAHGGHNAAKRSTELTPKSSTKVIVLVLVVLVLEWAGKIGAEQSCQVIYDAVRLTHGFACKRKTRCLPARIEISHLGFAISWLIGSSERTQSGKAMLVRIVAMLTKLVERFDPYQYRVRENAPSVAGPFEHEDDDEHEDD
jgi:hypothetical protein